MNKSGYVVLAIAALLVVSAFWPNKSSRVTEAASASVTPTSTQPSDDGVPEVLTQVAEEAPHLEPPPSAAGSISYPVQAEAAATQANPVSPVKTVTYGPVYSCGPHGCSVVYPSSSYNQNYYPARRGLFGRRR